VDPCHARVIGFGVPIIVDGEHIATVTGGECVSEPLPEDFVRQLAREFNVTVYCFSAWAGYGSFLAHTPK